MKNVHILPTAKPSRVYQTNLGNYYFVESYVPDTVHTFKNHNIYITSNEEISLWDWYLMEFNGLQITQCTSEEELTSIEGRGDCIKIALTTDYDLIQSGVQSVDDEFLKWFVKNPSCEEIEVVYDYFQVDKSWSQVLQGSTSLAKRHKIVTPKEQKTEEQLPTQWFKTEEIDTWVGSSEHGGRGKLVVLHQCGENREELIKQLKTLINGIDSNFEWFAQ